MHIIGKWLEMQILDLNPYELFSMLPNLFIMFLVMYPKEEIFFDAENATSVRPTPAVFCSLLKYVAGQALRR